MKNFLKELVPYIIIVICVVLVRTYIITPGIVNGESMEETLFDNDLVLVNKIGLKWGIDRYDIVVVYYNNDTLIKWVIGLPGETIEYKDNELYIDGIKEETPVEFEYTKDFTLTAGKDEYIVLGDNRNVSKDSRMIGPIEKNNIKGKVNIALFPFSRFGIIN